jgi:magnesium chelatase family protein
MDDMQNYSSLLLEFIFWFAAENEIALIATFTNCPCGNYLGGGKPCTCKASELAIYLNHFSKYMEKFDVSFQINRLEYNELIREKYTVTSSEIYNTITKCQQIQKSRQGLYNAFLTIDDKFYKNCGLDMETDTLLEEAYLNMLLTHDQVYSLIKVARTIADLESSANIQKKNMAEAIQFRFSPLTTLPYQK